MNIIHYTIGIPPFRHGGASKYALDLALEQSKIHNVSLLFPGDTLRLGNQSYFSTKKQAQGLAYYTIQNPVVSPLLFGIKDANAILNHKKEFTTAVLERFHQETSPDVVHLHTLMGIPDTLLQFWKKKGVKIVFTSHDYYGICTRVNLINEKSELCTGPEGSLCAKCNHKSKDYWFLKLCNSSFFIKYKHLLPVRATHLIDDKQDQEEDFFVASKSQVASFDALIAHYKNIFSLIDCFHFNSAVAQEVYLKYCQVNQSYVVPITTNKIQDRRLSRLFSEKKICLGFIGSVSDYKGFPMLKSVLSELHSSGISNFTINVWEDGLTGIDNNYPFIEYKGKYTNNQLQEVFTGMDLLVVPSVWKETFSLVALEALSFGTPVLVSENVGAKIIIEKYDKQFVFSGREGLKKGLENISNRIAILQEFNDKIMTDPWQHSMSYHSAKISGIYSEITK
jgi:glycosyltransferase involved in cell wall biosynthesis